MSAPANPEAIRDVNTRYHDGAAAHYDAKWGIDWGQVGRDQVLGKVEKALGGEIPTFARSLEIGAGTGYFSLHLHMAGLVGEATCTDISPGMIEVLEANATMLELDVETTVCDAEELPFEDGSFDLVFGHAVLHHIPDLERAFSEFHRVLAPGGMIVFAGEPSRYGDRIAQVPKVAATTVAPAWRAAIGAGAAPEGHADGGECNHELERHVDVHAFLPADLERAAQGAGFDEVRVTGEELLANWFGWTNRALEHTAVSEEIPELWRQYAFRGYLALQKVDRGLLEGRLPATIFYNLLLSARRPG
ncbi:MAG: class I SAM-dependent methyltransferase [Solirubrobacterales bacterium]